MIFAVYGCGGFGREMIRPMRAHARAEAERTGASSHEVLFLDDTPGKIGRVVHGARVVQLKDVAEPNLVVCVADIAARRTLVRACEAAGAAFTTLVAATSIVGDGVTVGEGSVISDFCTLTADCRIGRHVHVNHYGYISHDCVVGDFVTLGPRVGVNGHTVIEDDVYIGAGAMIRNGTYDVPITIGRGAVVGMGAVVTRSVPAGVTVVGNPARVRD